MLDVLEAANQLAFGLGKGLAVLGNGERGELVDGAAHQLAEAEDNAAARCGTGFILHSQKELAAAPTTASTSAAVELALAGDDLARCRVEDIDVVASLARPIRRRRGCEGCGRSMPTPSDIQGIEMVLTGGGVLRDLTNRTTPSVTDA